jgi:hypothetical protein
MPEAILIRPIPQPGRLGYTLWHTRPRVCMW